MSGRWRSDGAQERFKKMVNYKYFAPSGADNCAYGDAMKYPEGGHEILWVSLK
jgi:hypothetical protein